MGRKSRGFIIIKISRKKKIYIIFSYFEKMGVKISTLLALEIAKYSTQGDLFSKKRRSCSIFDLFDESD